MNSTVSSCSRQHVEYSENRTHSLTITHSSALPSSVRQQSRMRADRKQVEVVRTERPRFISHFIGTPRYLCTTHEYPSNSPRSVRRFCTLTNDDRAPPLATTRQPSSSHTTPRVRTRTEALGEASASRVRPSWIMWHRRTTRTRKHAYVGPTVTRRRRSLAIGKRSWKNNNPKHPGKQDIVARPNTADHAMTAYSTDTRGRRRTTRIEHS